MAAKRNQNDRIENCFVFLDQQSSSSDITDYGTTTKMLALSLMLLVQGSSLRG